MTEQDKIPGFTPGDHVRGRSLDINHKFVKFKGTDLHYVNEFEGDRYSVIWFLVNLDDMGADDTGKLQNMFSSYQDFRLDTIFVIKRWPRNWCCPQELQNRVQP